jgi:hypothetical protein
MAEWWKKISESLKVESPRQNQSLRDRLDREKEHLRKDRERHYSQTEHRRAGESDEQARMEDARALAHLLGWKLDVHVEGLTDNPALIDDLWFGVKRYLGPPIEEDGPYEIYWKLHFFRTCPHCKNLIPTLELGDSAEIVEASKKSMLGQDILVPKATKKLAAYLEELDRGAMDPYMSRYCPHCRKPIKGLLT